MYSSDVRNGGGHGCSRHSVSSRGTCPVDIFKPTTKQSGSLYVGQQRFCNAKSVCGLTGVHPQTRRACQAGPFISNNCSHLYAAIRRFRPSAFTHELSDVVACVAQNFGWQRTGADKVSGLDAGQAEIEHIKEYNTYLEPHRSNPHPGGQSRRSAQEAAPSHHLHRTPCTWEEQGWT